MNSLTGLLLASSLISVHADVTAYWRFEGGTADSTATTLTDSSGNTNTGTPSGGPVYRASTPPGYPGTCSSLSLEFDGINDIVEIPASASLDFSGSFTVEFWMRSPGTGAAGQDLIIDKSHGTGGATGWLFQSRPGVGIIDFGMGNGAAFPVVSSNSDLFDDQWHHLAGTYDGNTIEFFVDGVSQGTTVAGAYSDNANPVRMGNTSSINRYFKGHLDEVRISDAVLAPTDFIFFRPSPTTVAYWRFEGGTADSAATTIADSSNNAHTGTPSGGPIHRAATPAGFPGICNSRGLEFDGINDIVEIPASASLDFSGSFTVEFWMRSPGTGAAQDLIIDKSHGTGGATGWFFQSRPGVGIVDFGMGNGAGFPLVSSNSDLFDDQWHHLAGTYDGNTIEFFVDGVSQGTTVAGTYSDNTSPVRMGNTSSINRYFKGHLDEVRISNAVLKVPDFLYGILAGALRGGPFATSVTMDNMEHFGIQFRRLSSGTTDAGNVYTTDRYVYTIELSGDLDDWNPAGPGIRYTTPIDHGDGTETVSAYLFDPFPTSGTKFLRIHIALRSP